MKSQYPIIIGIAVLVAIIIGVIVSLDTTQPTEVIVEQEISLDEIKQISEKAFIYSYPMLEGYKTMYYFAIDDTTDQFRAPFNVMKHDQQLLTPDFTAIVSPNSDTLYSMFWMDLRKEPIMLSVGKIDENRYFVFQLIDFYSHNFGYVGTRTTGNDGGNYLIAGPTWEGEIPKGIDKAFRSETEFVLVGGRTQAFGNDDLPNAIKTQKSYTLTPLSKFLNQPEPKFNEEITFPAWSSEKAYSAEFINYFNLILTWSQIHPSEQQLFSKFSKIGVKAGEHIDFDTIDPEIKDAIESGVDLALDKMNQNIPNLGEFENGWIKVNAFGDREFHGTDYLRKSSAAIFAYGGNSIEEAFYPNGSVDKDNIPLDANLNNYVLKFNEEPPVRAFWSVTMYHADTKLMVENSLDRWNINSVSDLTKNEDGSFEIYLQYESPGDDKESNWLPTPDGPFYMLMRLYLPSQELIDGTWEMPIIEKESGLN